MSFFPSFDLGKVLQSTSLENECSSIFQLEILSNDDIIHYSYLKSHNDDAGVDVYFPESINVPPLLSNNGKGTLISLKIRGKMLDGRNNETAYFLMPRSSIYKTPIRMSNSIGLIDAGYRGELCVVVDNHSDKTYTIEKGTRMFQVVGPSLRPITIQIVDKINTNTERGEGGFGSTGK